MKKGNQRQEVLFLGLAVAVLVVVVALGALRSYTASPAKKVETAARAPRTAAAKPRVPPKAAVATLPVSTRDPFRPRPAESSSKPPPAGGASDARRPARPEAEWQLVGILSGASPVAVIHGREKHYYVTRGDRVGSYTVSRVEPTRVVLTKGGEHLTLGLSSGKGPRAR